MKKTSIIIFLNILSLSIYAQNSLDDLLIEAAQNNPALKSQYYKYSAALERVDQQNTLPDPTVSFGYFISPVETRVGAQRFKLSVSQMFPWMGSLKAKETLAAAGAKVQFEKFQELKNELFYQVRLAYSDLYLLRQEIKLKEEDVAVLQSYEPITKTKYESNLVSLSDLIRVQIATENAQSDLAVMMAQERPLLAKLNTLVNREIERNIVTELPFNEISNTRELDSALSNHPSIIRAQSQILEAEQQIELSNRRTKPNIGIGLDYAFVDERTDMDVADNGKDIFMPMVSLSLPLFGKRNRALEKEAQLSRSSALSALEATENQIRSSWTTMNYEQERSEITLERFKNEEKQTELLLSVLLSEYSNNSRNFEELLATQQKLLKLRLTILENEVALIKSRFFNAYLSGTTLNKFNDYEIK